jgi:flagellar biosynthetic protein FliQ
MDTAIVIDIAREALWLIIICSAPLLLVSLVVGLVISIFQTVTSIQEQTLTFVPKLLGVFLAVMIFGLWIMRNVSEFMQYLVENFNTFVNG